jgi:hypothetical protein
MTPDHDPSLDDHEQLPDVTLYVLGALAGAERERVRAHIQTCPVCTQELTRVAGLPGLLDRISPGTRGEALFSSVSDADITTVQPPAELYDHLINRVVAGRARRKRLTIMSALAAAAVVIAVPAVAFAVRSPSPTAALAQGPAPPAAQQSAFQPMSVTSELGKASATAAVQDQPWGSSITIQAVDWKPNLVIRLYVVTINGETREVGGWRSTGPGTTVCAATTWYPKDRLVQLQAVEDGGPVVASMSL